MSEPDPPVRRERRGDLWRSPAGISAIAAVLGVLVVVIGWFAAPLVSGGATGGPSGAGDGSGDGSGDGGARSAVFVYGSSMPGSSRFELIEEYVESSSRDTVEGLLYDSGLGYPLAKFGAGDPIPGYLLDLDDATAEEFFREQTAVEAGLFHPVEVRTGSGRTATAYEWIGATDGVPRIDSWDESTAHYGSLVQIRELAAGECFANPDTAATALLMWCAADHPWEVADVVELGDDVSPDGPGLQEAAVAACEPALGRFTGDVVGGGELALEVHPPGADDWAAGDRRVTCAVTAPGAMLEGRA